MTREISKLLNIEHDLEPINPKEPSSNVVVAAKPAQHMEMDDAEQDYEKVRDTLQDLLSTSQDAIKEMFEISMESGVARDYEVLSGLIKTASDTANKLIMLQQKVLDLKKGNMIKQDVGKTPIRNAQQVNVDKIVFSGTPADLLKALKEVKESDNDK